VSTEEQLAVFLRVLLGFCLGALVGLEREFRGHEAGIRTNALVCGAATLFGAVSLELGDDRVAAGVVQGIGFIGAGIVFQRGRSVHGVTTAATIWMMAALGLAIASKMYLLACLIAVLVVVLLELAPVSDFVLAHSRARGWHRARKGREPTGDDAAEGPPVS
jgi:putative Mg2+ transporter-C (MgtC) family protein